MFGMLESTVSPLYLEESVGSVRGGEGDLSDSFLSSPSGGSLVGNGGSISAGRSEVGSGGHGEVGSGGSSEGGRGGNVGGLLVGSGAGGGIGGIGEEDGGSAGSMAGSGGGLLVETGTDGGVGDLGDGDGDSAGSMAGGGGNGGGLLVGSGAGGGVGDLGEGDGDSAVSTGAGGGLSVVSRLGLGSMRQSLYVGTITFSEVPGGAKWIPNSAQHHTAGPALCQKLVMGRVSGSVCCPSWWTCISTITLPSDSSVTHGITAMASKSSFSCACVLCTFRVFLVLRGELCPPLILTRLRWLFLPSTGGLASAQISS